jgi:hypothetical protein
MDYKLAKQLKNAGFPQEGYKIYCYNTSTENGCYAEPTLPELIDACGENKFVLWKGNTKWLAIRANDNSWVNDEGVDVEIMYQDFIGEGETSEEAVARLWLRLNK